MMGKTTPPGFKLVPVAPTDAMLSAGQEADETYAEAHPRSAAFAIYRAMIEAADAVGEVWVIVKESSVYGREKGGALALATTEMYDSGPPHPAFTSEAEAREYLASLPHNWGLTPMRLELLGGKW